MKTISDTAYVITTTTDIESKYWYWNGDYWVSDLNVAKFYGTRQSAQKAADLLSRENSIEQVTITLSCYNE